MRWENVRKLPLTCCEGIAGWIAFTDWRWKVITNLDKKGLPKELVAVFDHGLGLGFKVCKTQSKRKWKVIEDCNRVDRAIQSNFELPIAAMDDFLLTHTVPCITSHDNPLAVIGGRLLFIANTTNFCVYQKIFIFRQPQCSFFYWCNSDVPPSKGYEGVDLWVV